jgi:prepilin-type N-terminal cleavage/methylation domain-containing protein
MGFARPGRFFMHTAYVRTQSGLALLEVMVALVILGLVAAGFLEAFAGALRASAQSRDWAQGLVYAELGMEELKVGGSAADRDATLGGGFTRHTEITPWRPGLDLATVTVGLPNGGRLEIERLLPAQ